MLKFFVTLILEQWDFIEVSQIDSHISPLEKPHENDVTVNTLCVFKTRADPHNVDISAKRICTILQNKKESRNHYRP